MAESTGAAAYDDLVIDHHRQIRVAYLGGFSFLAYEGVVWLASAASAGLLSVTTAMIVLVVGGTLSPVGAPIIQKFLRRPVVGRDNPLLRLSVTSAFIIPLCYPVIAAATLANTNWFFQHSPWWLEPTSCPTPTSTGCAATSCWVVCSSWGPR